MLPVKLDHCVIHVSDWARSNDFYARVIGAEVVVRGKGFAYKIGDVQLNCHGPDAIGTPVARLPVQPGNSDLCFAWDGPIADAISHLAACGVPVEVGPVPRSGVRGAATSVYFRDPDGSLLEFMSYAGS
jgi:catechol 2,3-dioxygenase-like lactoylglutathione lyase family enzyme